MVCDPFTPVLGRQCTVEKIRRYFLRGKLLHIEDPWIDNPGKITSSRYSEDLGIYEKQIPRECQGKQRIPPDRNWNASLLDCLFCCEVVNHKEAPGNEIYYSD